MRYYRLIAPPWLAEEGKPKVLEGKFSDAEIKARNEDGYNIYYLPNYPKNYMGGTVFGNQVDTFEYVFIDFDLKSGTHASKDDFLVSVANNGIIPSRVIDSGNGIHVYFRVKDLDCASMLRLCRRLMRASNTDPAVGQVFQLMRYPGTWNTKSKGNFIKCEILFEEDVSYTCEELDKLLPPISEEDEKHCQRHYDMTHAIQRESNIDDALPPKFGKLIRENHEAKSIWSSVSDDRSRNDYRLGHIMFASGFTKEEAASVLVNSAKALSRAPTHRVSYASNIIDKIWTYELDPKAKSLSHSVEDILKRSGDTLKGTPFRCHKRIDNTEHGFRLGQVVGLVAGSGVGKTAFSLNMFKWFVEQNPDYHHFFVPLEQPANEIADRWQTMCGADKSLHKKVHVLSNYDEDGNFRHLSLNEIKDYILEWQNKTGLKAGCVVIDHIGVLKKKGSNDENQDLMTICHSMKAFAVETNTLLVMQSQSSREKSGIGDLELNKDAAYGTVFFESYCDFLITLWQPLKRCAAEEGCPTVTAFKFCKIRHKKAKKDVIKEDTCYYFYFDSDTELMRDLTQSEKVSFDYYLPKATNKRKADRKTELIQYQSVPFDGEKHARIESPGNKHRH